MKLFIWYSFVVLDTVLLFTSFVMKSFYLAIFSFIIAIILKKVKNTINFPDLFANFKFIKNENSKK